MPLHLAQDQRTTVQRDAIPLPADGRVIYNTDTHLYNYYDGTAWNVLGSGSGGSITVKDEGTVLSTAAVSLDFVGTGITATNVGGAITVTVPGGGSTLAVQDFQRDWSSATTYYEGIAAKGTALASSGWSVVKTTITGSTLDTRNVYIGTGTWTGRSSLAYTLSNSYSI
jgi:hypothetical protein